MSSDHKTQWQLSWLAETGRFASECARLRDANRFEQPRPVLEDTMANLATELWDRQFSQSEIRSAFTMAVDALPRYAAGEERRGGSR
jgi:SOS response regulatory protein OraA/RecX